MRHQTSTMLSETLRRLCTTQRASTSLCTLLGKQNQVTSYLHQVDTVKNMTRANRNRKLGGWDLAQITLHFYNTLASPVFPFRTVANILSTTHNTTREFARARLSRVYCS